MKNGTCKYFNGVYGCVYPKDCCGGTQTMTSDIVPTDPHKMHRTDDPETSVDRAYDLDTESQKVVLISVFVVVGVNGMTTSEVAQAIGKDRATFSSTITQLRREDLLFYSGIRRDKQNVWVSTKYRTDWALTATPNMFQAMNEQREKDQEGAIKDRKLRALEERLALAELQCQEQAQRLDAFQEALTPSPDTKARYWGGDDLPMMNWTDIKQLLSIIRERAEGNVT